jgi:hypothetical protein
MSEERSVLHVPAMSGKGTATIGVEKARELADNQEELSAAEMKQRIARVLERGIIIDRATVQLPEGLYGEWVADDPVEISRMKLLGFVEDTEHAVDRATNSDGTGVSKLGDVIFMTAPMAVKEMIDAVRTEMYEKANPVKDKQKEERDFQANADKSGLPVISEGDISPAREQEIRNALGATKT